MSKSQMSLKWNIDKIEIHEILSINSNEEFLEYFKEKNKQKTFILLIICYFSESFEQKEQIMSYIKQIIAINNDEICFNWISIIQKILSILPFFENLCDNDKYIQIRNKFKAEIEGIFDLKSTNKGILI